MAIENTLDVRLVHAAKTLSEWSAIQSTPKMGEVCLEKQETTPPISYKIKIGDGSTPYSSLPYFGTVVAASGAPQVVEFYTYPDNFPTESLRGKTVMRIHQLSLSYSVDTSSGATTITLNRDASNFKEIRPGNNINFTPESGVGDPDWMTIAASMDFSSLDVDEYAQVEWDDENDKIKFYNIKEENGKIVLGTSFKTLEISGPLRLSTTSSSSNPATLSIDDASISRKGAVSLLNTYTSTNASDYSHATTNAAITAALSGLNSTAATSDANNSKDVIVSVTETNGKVSSTKKTITEGNKIDISTPSTGVDVGKLFIAHEEINTSVTDNRINSGEREVDIITAVTTDDGHVTGYTIDKSSNIIAADIKAPVKEPDDSTWNYRITGGDITIGEDTARIPSLKGNTLVWNQLVNTSTSSVTLISAHKYYTVIGGNKSIQTGAGSTISVTGGTDMVIDLTKMFGSDTNICDSLGVTDLIDSQGNLTTDTTKLNTAIANFEKLFPNSYYPYCESRLVNLGGYGVKWNQLYDTTVPTAVTNHKYYLSEVVSSTKTSSISTTISYTSGSTNRMCIDLTMMFGPGSEPTLEEFEAMFPKEYYEYDAGTETNIFDAIGDKKLGLESTGFNQYNEGTANVFAGEEYYVGGTYTPSLAYSDGTAITVTNNKFTATKTDTITVTGGSDDTVIKISDNRDGTYEPYKKDTLDLDWIKDIKDSNDNQLFPYGLLSAGSVRDEVHETYAIKRLGIVDLGDLTWTYYNQQGSPFFYSTLPIMKPGAALICPIYKGISLQYFRVTDKSISAFYSISSTHNINVRDSSYTDADLTKLNPSDPTATHAPWLEGVMLYYELETPEEIPLAETHIMSYAVDDHGTEQQIPINVSSVISAPFVGTFEYQSNFKDTVLDLIDRVNSYKNPVKSVYNTPQTSGKLAVYDSNSTVASSSHFVDLEATIETGDTVHRLPTVQQMIDYVTASQASALQYKGTVSSYNGSNSVTSKVTAEIQSGWLYFIDTQFTLDTDQDYLPAGTYNIGDFIVWNEENDSFDVITGVHNINNPNTTLAFGSTAVTSQTIATIDGRPITVGMPVLNIASSTSGNTSTFIDSITYASDTVSVTKKNIPNASSTTAGLVDIINVESATNTTPDNSVSSAYNLLQALNVRDTGVGSLSSLGSDNYGTLHKKIAGQSATDFYPTTKFDVISKTEDILGTSDSNIGYLKRKFENNAYTWELDPYGGGNLVPAYVNNTEVSPTTESTLTTVPSDNFGLRQKTHDGANRYKVPITALCNDSTSVTYMDGGIPRTENVIVILNGNFS